MKIFENENYYQMLQVSANSRADEIKLAYRDALAIYEKESLVTYSLFSEPQREHLLKTIQTAFETLIDEGKRAAYNQMLIDTGQVDEDLFSKPVLRKSAAQTDTRNHSTEKCLSQRVQKKAHAPEIKQLIEAVLAKKLLSGLDLKRLREAYGIEINEIYAITRITSSTLKRIEANQFDDLPAEIYVKQFLKTYADILHIDSQHVVDGYLRFMAQDKSILR